MARQFNGTSDLITIADNNFDGLATGTISFIFKTSYKDAFQKILFKDGAIDIGLTNFGGSAKLFGEIGGVGNLGEVEEFNVATGTWYSGIFSWDGTNLKAYRDGVEKDSVSATTTQNNNGNSLTFGSRAAGEYFNGELCELAMWNRALDSSEISFIGSKGFSALFCRRGLLLYMPTIGRFSPEIDFAGGNSGTLTGTTVYPHPRIIYPTGANGWTFSSGAAPPAGDGGNDWPTFMSRGFNSWRF